MRLGRVLAVTPDAVPTRREGVSAHSLDEDLVLYPDWGDQAFLLNATAARVWQLLDGRTSLLAASTRIADEYGVDPDEALGDLLELAEYLRDAGLILTDGCVRGVEA